MSSEYGEDIWIIENVNLPASGFYMDLGCAWPEYNSNTQFLRKREWKGVAIDANPVYAKDWTGVAPFVSCVIGDGNPAEFEYCDAPDLGKIGRGIPVITTALDSLIDAPSIDFISCDLEGYEYEALSRLDWKKFRPKVVVSEYATHGKPNDYRVANMLIPMGYELRHMTVANMIYVLR